MSLLILITNLKSTKILFQIKATQAFVVMADVTVLKSLCYTHTHGTVIKLCSQRFPSQFQCLVNEMRMEQIFLPQHGTNVKEITLR